MDDFKIKQYICIKHQISNRWSELNRLNIVLVEQRRTRKWLAEILGKNEVTVSYWCTNKSQPSLETWLIVKDLNVNTQERSCFIEK